MEPTEFRPNFVAGLVGDALWVAVLALERDGAGLPFLFPDSDTSPQMENAQLHLSTKAYWRGRDAVGAEQRLTTTTEKRLGLTAPAIAEGCLWHPFLPSNSTTFSAVRSLSRVEETDPVQVASLASLFDSVESLDGVLPALDVVRDHGNTVTSWRRVMGERHLLGTFEYCRRSDSLAQVRYLLSLLVWRNQLTLAAAGTLQLISQRRSLFSNPPLDDCFRRTAECFYQSNTIKSIISKRRASRDLRDVDEDD
ncbi:hypothetical protein MMPV_004908 [Pyropia vietnamensis]